MAVGLWDFFADEVLAPMVELDEEYSYAEFINCTGKLEGNKVYLSDIPAFKFAGIFFKKNSFASRLHLSEMGCENFLTYDAR